MRFSTRVSTRGPFTSKARAGISPTTQYERELVMTSKDTPTSHVSPNNPHKIRNQILATAQRALDSRFAVIVIDSAGDMTLRNDLRSAAIAAGQRFVATGPDGPDVYELPWDRNPVDIGLMLVPGESGISLSESIHARRYVSALMRVVRASGKRLDLHTCVRYLDPSPLLRLVLSLPVSRCAMKARAHLNSLTARQMDLIAEQLEPLAMLVRSDLGRWIDRPTFGASRFDLQSVIENQTVVYFNLDAYAEPVLAQRLATIIANDLVRPGIQTSQPPSLVVLTGSSEATAEQLAKLITWAQFAGISLLTDGHGFSPGARKLLQADQSVTPLDAVECLLAADDWSREFYLSKLSFS